MKEQKMTDEQLSQELNKSKGGRTGGKLLSLFGGIVIVSGIILGGNMVLIIAGAVLLGLGQMTHGRVRDKASQQTFDTKRAILQKEYHIEMTPEMEQEMSTMCNLSLNISEEALNRGLAQGRKEGRLEGLNETAARLLSMGLSVEDVSKGTSLPLETVEKIKKQIIEKNK